MVLNGDSVLFPLERMLRTLAGMKGVYVMALLDCNREEVEADKWQTSISSDLESLIGA